MIRLGRANAIHHPMDPWIEIALDERDLLEVTKQGTRGGSQGGAGAHLKCSDILPPRDHVN